MTQLLDLSAFQITSEIKPDEQILDVVVLVRTVNPECGHDGIYICNSPGVSWLTQIGMVSAARSVLLSGIYNDPHEED